MMERLTYKNDGYAEMFKDVKFHEIVDRLAYYEDLEEQGRLVVLPCKVGDTIYRIIKPSGKCKAFVPTLPDMVAPFGIYYRNVMGAYSYVPFDELGKTVFLTREEAEAALKEKE